MCGWGKRTEGRQAGPLTCFGGEKLEMLALVQDCQAGWGWVHGVATVWLGHWLGGGFGRTRPDVWGLVRGLSEVRAQTTGSPVLVGGRWVLPVGQYSVLPVYLWPQKGNQVLFVSGICLSRTEPSARAWSSQHIGGQGGAGQGQSFQCQVRNAAAWPHPGHLASCLQGAGASLHWHRLDPALEKRDR